MKTLLIYLLFGCLLPVSTAFAQADSTIQLSYYLPEGVTYNKRIPTPKDVLGHEIGTWHLTHDQLVYYMYKLAEASPRVVVEQIGHTYEHRPLLNVIITSEENQKKLPEIHEKHLRYIDPSGDEKADTEDMPLIVRLGYSIHGNEASGVNASVLVAYYLAAAQDALVESMLQQCVILIDPSLNPDGMQRFSTWVNEHKSASLNPDPASREFHETWPGGRTNHYWFDLNRDWLLVQHPESKARVKLYHDWMPNIQTDHHEMGTNSTFFFQPGVPARKNPLIPDENVILTKKIAAFHAKAFDEQQRLYYSEEDYDDFYPGKGSTYPDLQGGIGILFEQASARGHQQESDNGLLSFPFAIKNHVLSSLSTLEAGMALKKELINYQHKFFRSALAESQKAPEKWVVLGTQEDPARANMLAGVLQMHQITLHKLKQKAVLEGDTYDPASSFAVPMSQPQYKLIKALFERRTRFQDSLFYDVSAWDFDLAFGADSYWVKSKEKADFIGEKMHKIGLPDGEIPDFDANTYAYLVRWNQYFAPGLVYALQRQGVMVKVASESFDAPDGNKFDRGTIVIPVGIQSMSPEKIHGFLGKFSAQYHLHIDALQSGDMNAGPDIGSRSLWKVEKPVIAMLTGDGVSGYAAGEIWHLLDQRFAMPVTMIDLTDFEHVPLTRYNILVMPDGSYGSLGVAAQNNIKNWVQQGGTLVAMQRSIKKLAEMGLISAKIKEQSKDSTSYIPYADRGKSAGSQVIGGAIFNMEIDNTHPLAFGYRQPQVTVFKRGNLALQWASDNIKNPFHYTSNPLLSGYVSADNLQLIGNTPAVCVDSFGAGKVIALVDDYNFRAYWYGTNKMFMNAVFFGGLINTR